MGRQLIMPHMIEIPEPMQDLKAKNFTKDWRTNTEITKACLEKASKHMKQVADRKRIEREFQVGDLMLIKLNPAQMRSRVTSKTDTRLLRRYEGHVPVIAKVSRVAYKVQLPDWLHIHPIMHVSCLKPFYKDLVDPDR